MFSSRYLAIYTILGYWLVSSLYHLQFSLWIVNPIITPWGEITLKYYGNWLLSGSLILLLGFLAIRCLRAKKILLHSFFWLCWLVLVAINNLYLMATPIENIHFIQYGLLSWLLLLVFPENITRVLIWTTVLGIMDELLQYFYITKSYSNYLDFNDFNINLIAAIGGVMVYFSYRDFNKDDWNLEKLAKSWELKFSLLGISVFTLLVTLGWIIIERQAQQFGHWHPHFFNGEYYILTPWQGLLVMLLTILLFSPFFINYRPLFNKG